MLKNVNTTNILSAIELGCRTMCNVFNRDDNNIPFMNTYTWPEVGFKFSAYHSESHIPGRHLNALLTAEEKAGVHIEESAIHNHATAAYYSFSGAIPLPLNRLAQNDEPIGKPLRFLNHNIREGFHALYALSKYRSDERADAMMLRAIAFLFEHFIPTFSWDEKYLSNLGTVVENGPLIAGEARAIGPLVKYYRSSGYEPALELAICLKEGILPCFLPSGEFDAERAGSNHAHSITCTMSSLAQLAETLHDAVLMERVRAYYDNGLQKLRNEIGWAAESSNPNTYPARGEVNISGDMLETALILARFGYPEYFDDAERMLRGHILPSQVRDTSFIRNPPNPDGRDCLRDVAERHLGAFGFPAPYGHRPVDITHVSFNMDIVGGTVASLCEAFADCTSFENGIHRVNLLFDRETENIRVEAPYTHDVLSVTIHRHGPLFVHIPSWVERNQMNITGAFARILEDWIYIPQPIVGLPVRIKFPLTLREIVLNHATHELRTRLRGDEVIAMDNCGMPETFFESYE